MCVDAFGKLPNAAGWQPALPRSSSDGFFVILAPRRNGVLKVRESGTLSPARETRAVPGNCCASVIAFPLSPAKRLRLTPLGPAAAVLFRPVRSVSFSRRNPPESAIRDGHDRLRRRAGFSPADQRT